MSWAGKLLRGPGLFLLVVLAVIPPLWHVLPGLEKRAAPILAEFAVVKQEPSPYGMLVTVEFDKRRACRFVGLAWYHADGRRIRLEYGAGRASSRPTGFQRAGPWVLHDVQSLEGTRAFTEHECHPLYHIPTQVYPPQ